MRNHASGLEETLADLVLGVVFIGLVAHCVCKTFNYLDCSKYLRNLEKTIIERRIY